MSDTIREIVQQQKDHLSKKEDAAWEYFEKSHHMDEQEPRYIYNCGFYDGANTAQADARELVGELVEALRRTASTFESSILEFEGFDAAGNDPVLREAEQALTKAEF